MESHGEVSVNDIPAGGVEIILCIGVKPVSEVKPDLTTECAEECRGWVVAWCDTAASDFVTCGTDGDIINHQTSAKTAIQVYIIELCSQQTDQAELGSNRGGDIVVFNRGSLLRAIISVARK